MANSNPSPLTTTGSDSILIPKVAAFVRDYMSRFDGSHDFSHIKRVLGISHSILSTLRDPLSPHHLSPPTPYNDDIITLAALLHDVGDRKYLRDGETGESTVRDVLLDLGATKEVADTVQTICSAVSWNAEVSDPRKVGDLIERFPELAIVQDADRLDSIGAVGVGRVFMFGGAKTERGLGACVDMFGFKLLKLHATMKTSVGRELAAVRTERLRSFEAWFAEEWGVEGVGTEVLGAAGVRVDPPVVEKDVGEGIVVSRKESARREMEKEIETRLRREIEVELRATMESELKGKLEKEFNVDLMDEL